MSEDYRSAMHEMPKDWADRRGWDEHFKGELAATTRTSSMRSSLQYVGFALQQGGRTWFPGCGLDVGPAGFAALGASVVATDFSSVAIEWQRQRASESVSSFIEGWKAFVEQQKLTERAGSFTVLEQDFTVSVPPGPFDVCINRRAFQGLSKDAMAKASVSFFGALRPGGAAIIDTMNLQGEWRNVLEDALLAAGFFIPLNESERWFRGELAKTGIVYAMILGRPIIPQWDQYPPGEAEALRKRDKEILDGIAAAYRERQKAEVPRAEERLKDPATRVAHLVYSTG
jgi:hypothetical protein